MNINETIEQTAKRAQKAARRLAEADTELKNKILLHLADQLIKEAPALLAANEEDVKAAAAQGMAAHMLDRLTLTPSGIEDLARSVRDVATLPDPVGSLEDERQLPSGLEVRRLRIPLGLIAFICEARPSALVEAGSLTIKTGNGLMVKCGKEMARTAAALAETFAASLAFGEIPVEAVTVLPTASREDLKELLLLSETIDLVIPRGGEGLIRFVSENSRIPVLKHFKGVCHLYVDEGADYDLALKLLINGKTQRPSTCNSLECLVVHEKEADFLLRAAGALKEKGVTIKADPKAAALIPEAEVASESDWGCEFLDLTLAVRLVPDYQAALEHIAAYGSNHTEVIVTQDQERGRHFQRVVEAGCVMVNASSRLNDGSCLGLGAEIGISTTRLHAYGPMGLRELTTTRFIVTGSGQVR